LKIKKGVFIGDAHISCSVIQDNKYKLGPIKLDEKSFLANQCVVLPNTFVGKEVTIGSLSHLSGREFSHHSTWVGSPPECLSSENSSSKKMDISAGNLQYYIARIVQIIIILLAEYLFILSYIPLIILAIFSSYFDDRWMIVLIPIAAVFSGILFCFIVLLLKWTLIRKMQTGDFRIWGAHFLAWEFLSLLLKSCDSMLIRNIKGTPLFNMWLRLLGAEVGKSCYITTDSPQEPDLLVLGDNCIIDHCDVVGHHFDGHAFRLEKIHVGNDCSVGYHSVLLPNSRLMDNVSLLPLTVALVGEEFPSNTVWRGSLAEMVRTNRPILTV
jgi:acetyltransferase-like isoleucine patch superfamily enzyme